MRPLHLACVLFTSWAVAGPVLGDGGFFFVEGETVDLAQTRQEVVVAFYNDGTVPTPHVTYVLQTQYAGVPEELAWVIPVPATPMAVVTHANGELFHQLSQATKPRFMLVGPSEQGLIPGCACAGMRGLAEDVQEQGLVEVEARGQAGVFEWTALTSTGANALLDWLNANGFALPPTAVGVLDDYIQQETHFLALRVDEPNDLNTDDGEIAIPPIQFTCQSARRFYPMAISQISAAAETEVLIYVLAEHRVEAANVANALIDPNGVAYDPTSASNTNYESLFTQTISDLGGTALITECVGPAQYLIDTTIWPEAPAAVLDLTYLTRLRTVIAREQMDLDFEFQDGSSDDPVSNVFWIDLPEYVNAAVVAGQPLAALLLLALWRKVVSPDARRGRPNHPRQVPPSA